MTAILGISAFYHDAAAALVVDGRVVAAAQEERFSRSKHDAAFPSRAIACCLERAGLVADQLDYVGFYEKPLLKFDRLLETYLAFAPEGFRSFAQALPQWLERKLHLPREIDRGLGCASPRRYVFARHHESHAASAFFPSPFEEAAILTMDGVGEWTTASIGMGRGHRIELSHELRFPHSLGLLYSAFTYYCGFAVNDGEYKLMGLAPYGEPRFAQRILEHLVDLKQDGSFRLDLCYFEYCQGLRMTSKRFERLFGAPPRQPGTPLTQRDMDLAASVQRVTEEIVLRAARHVQRETGARRLCLAGGVALNCVANGRLLREGPFESIWVQPAAGDAGGALGVALLIWHQLLGESRSVSGRDAQQGSLLGPAFDDREIEDFLRSVGADYRRSGSLAALCEQVADAVAAGRVVGWFQDRMEFGPRALGARSILADARNPDMPSLLNRKVKFREGFRPFAALVLEEHARDYFELGPADESAYMLVVAPVREEQRVAEESGGASGIERLRERRSTIPAVTHLDHSTRIQTVDRERNPLLRQLLETFHAKTGCPVMINTSFNLGWEPIVSSPREAWQTFMSSDLDLLCIGSFLVEKRVRGWSAGSGAGRDASLEALLRSPCCGAALRPAAARLVCDGCARGFDTADGIPRLFWPHDAQGAVGDVTARVKAFYEETPFPNYAEHDSVRSLVEKSRAGLYARLLDQSIPYESLVLEVGCGTGQLANYLGVACRRVVGTDMSEHSLRLAESFRREQGLDRVRFVQMNLFRPVFPEACFDVVICNGVLHHTADPFGGFDRLVRLIRPGGHLVLGLYNSFGRLATDLRRRVFRLTGGRGQWLDPLMRGRRLEGEKRRAWFADQYRHPHESKHGFGEVIGWFERTGLEFVRSVPATTPDADGLAGESLFEPQRCGGPFERFLVQAGQVVAAGRKEGGFFVTIGRRPAA